jgi:hypothetical protein
MRKLIYFSIIKLALSTKIPFIRNTNLPICVNCLHFIEHTNNYPYDEYPNNKQGKCTKFGEVDVITGLVEYDFAKHCRDDIKKCGKNGSEYKEKNKS